MLSVHTCPLANLGGKKTGGMNVYVRELSAELGRRGTQVDIFTRAQDPCLPHIDANLLGDRVRVLHIPAGSQAPLSPHDIYPHLAEFTDQVLAFASQESLHYDLIHSHYWLSGIVASDLSAAWQVPVIQMFHTLGMMKNRIAQRDDEKEPPLRIDTEAQIIKQADLLIAATPAERIQMMWLYGARMQKIQVVSPGVNVHHFRPIPRSEAREALGMSEDEQMLLFVGRIEPLKGVETLVCALAILKQEIPECAGKTRLSIIGGALDDAAQEGTELARLMTLADELGLSKCISFLGAKSQELLPTYYAAAEMVMMPSHYESFGMVALEAMACGTPVVASEVGGLAYLIQDGVTGFHVPANDPEELAGRIRLLLENQTLRQEMSIAAAEYARRFDWGLIAAQVEKLYQQAEKLGQPGFPPILGETSRSDSGS